MDAQELRNLQEAYMEVYNELDEQLDDNKREKLIRYVRDSKKMVKTMGREMEDKYNPEPEGYEPESDKKIKKKTQREQVDLYDIILSHLLDEGYADTQQAAEAIMVNMSEEWRESICEELTGERRKRALEKGTPLANRVARAKEGQPRERTGPPYLGATKKAPIKRGGIGDRGRGKSEWTGYESDRGSGNKAARRAGIKVRDTSDEL
jgi:hypothetical protein